MQNILKIISILFLLSIFVFLSACASMQTKQLRNNTDTEEQSPYEEEMDLSEAEMFPKISVEFPDGAVYESADGGKSWTKDGEVQSPSVYARFKGEYPVRMSEEAMIVVGNEALPFLSSGEEQLFREENGEWIKPELLDKEMVFAGLVYVIEEKKEYGFLIDTSYYVPLEGKYRYTLKLIGPGGNEYMISVEFWAVDDTVSE